jgi:hypothetical protein
MNTLRRLPVLLALVGAAAFAQTNTIRNTTTAAAMTANQTTIALSSITNVVQGTLLYIDAEAMIVNGNPTSATAVTVRRGASNTAAAGHASGAVVLHGPSNWFNVSDPYGTCTAAATYVTPWINVRTGNQWLCSSVTGSWVPGFGNTSAPAQPTAAVASAAGLVTPSGPLFHITGTAAITGFNLPVGFTAGQVCAIPDGAFTTTNANNIAIASTGVVSKQLCWVYDAVTAKFYPSY